MRDPVEAEARSIVASGHFVVAPPPRAEGRARCRQCMEWVHATAPWAQALTDGMLVKAMATHIRETHPRRVR